MPDSSESARNLIRQAQTAKKGSETRRDALKLLLNTSASPDTALVLLIPQHLPGFVADFPDFWPTALDVAYDVSEHEDVQVRIKGYQLVVDLAEIGNVEEVGTMTDVLLQMLQTSLNDNSTEEIETLEKCIRSLIRLNPGAAVGLLTSILSKDSNIPANLVWDFIDGPAKEDIELWLAIDEQSDAHQAIKDNLYRVLETGDEASRLKAIHLLLLTSDTTGPRASKESASHLLSQIVLCATESSPGSTSVTSYFPHIDALLSLTPPSARPDHRWLLLLYCHSPAQVFEFAKLPADQVPTATASPSRLVEWVVASWNAWKEENKAGQANVVDERLSIRELGVRMTRTAVAQVPTWFPGSISLVTIMPLISDLEACLLLSYFLFLKFKGQIANLIDQGLARALQQISDVCKRGLANAYGSDNVTRAKWENVSKMCQNMLPPIQLDTVHPSWTLSMSSPVMTPPPPAAMVPASGLSTETPEAAPPLQPELATDLLVRRSIPTGPANRQRAPAPNSDRRMQAFQPNLPPMQIKRAPWGTKPNEPALPIAPVPLAIRSNPSARVQASPSTELSIRNSAPRSSSAYTEDTGLATPPKFELIMPSTGASRESPLLKRMATPSAEASIKRKHGQDLVDPLTSTVIKTASLASRLGIQVPVAPPNSQDRELGVRQKRQRHTQQTSSAQHLNANRPVTQATETANKPASHIERPIPSLLARMRDSGSARPPSAVGSMSHETIGPQPRSISPSISPNPDGVQRRGRGFAAAGIELASSPVGGFSIRGSTPNPNSRS